MSKGLCVKTIFKEIHSFSLLLIFDKGDNSKENFKMIDEEKELHYVAGLVPAYFKDLIKKANKHFEMVQVENEFMPVYRTKENIWGEERTCVITISKQLKEGQINGIYQQLKNGLDHLYISFPWLIRNIRTVSSRIE